MQKEHIVHACFGLQKAQSSVPHPVRYIQKTFKNVKDSTPISIHINEEKKNNIFHR